MTDKSGFNIWGAKKNFNVSNGQKQTFQAETELNGSADYNSKSNFNEKKGWRNNFNYNQSMTIGNNQINNFHNNQQKDSKPNQIRNIFTKEIIQNQPLNTNLNSNHNPVNLNKETKDVFIDDQPKQSFKVNRAISNYSKPKKIDEREISDFKIMNEPRRDMFGYRNKNSDSYGREKNDYDDNQLESNRGDFVNQNDTFYPKQTFIEKDLSKKQKTKNSQLYDSEMIDVPEIDEYNHNNYKNFSQFNSKGKSLRQEETNKPLHSHEQKPKPKKNKLIYSKTEIDKTSPSKEKYPSDSEVVVSKNTQNALKPTIDLKKVNELEKKRKEFVVKLDDQRDRSLSPASVNFMRSSKSLEPLENRREKKEIIKEPEPETEPKNDNNKLTQFTKPKELSNKISDKAKLLTMCGEKEMKDREERNLLNIFEADSEKSYYDNSLKRYFIKVHPDYAVKVFSRPAADTVMDDPENIRTPEVLTKTIDYLLENIADIDTHPELSSRKMFVPNGVEINFENISKFIEDRFRSVRQDFTILNLKGDKNTIESHERIARFLILCLNETLDYDAFSGQQSLFKLYVQQLNATLTSLREFYEFVNVNKNENYYVSPNQAEFYSYSILLSIKETFDLVSMLNKMPTYINQSSQIKLTRKIVRSITGKEWLTFFKIMKGKECNYLLSCIMSLYFKEMRSAGLSQLCSQSTKIKDCSYKTTIKKLNEIMLFQDSEECISFLEWFGINTSFLQNFDDDNFENTTFEIIKVQSEGEDANLPRITNRKFIEIKREGLLRKDIINGTQFDQSKNTLFFDTSKESSKKKEIFLANRVQEEKGLNSQNEAKLDLRSSNSLNTDLPVKGKFVFNDLPKTEVSGRTINNIYSENVFKKQMPVIENSYNSLNKGPFGNNINLFDKTSITDIPVKQISNDKTNDSNFNLFNQVFNNTLSSLDTSDNQKILQSNNLSKQNENISVLSKSGEKLKITTNKFNQETLKQNLSKLFNKIETLIKRDAIRHIIMKYKMDKRHQIITSILNFKRKRTLFNAMKEYSDNIKWNKYYIRELIKSKFGFPSYDNKLEFPLDPIDKNSFYNYKDIKNLLISKHEDEFNDHLRNLKESVLQNNIYHLKVVIFTEKKLLLNTQILNQLLNNINLNDIEMEQGSHFLNIIDRNNFSNSGKNLPILFNFILIDQIENYSQFIYDNLQNLETFSYGLIYIDYRNNLKIQNLMLILDYATKSTKKDLLLINFFTPSLGLFDFDRINTNIQMLEDKYNCVKTDIKLLYSTNYPAFSDIIEYYNNSELYSIFDKYIKFQNFIPYNIKEVKSYLNRYNFSRNVISYISEKSTFISKNFNEVNYHLWVSFFINIEIVTFFTKSINLILKQLNHNLDESLYQTLKVPYELHNNEDVQIINKLKRTKDVLVYLIKEISGLEILHILADVIKSSNFNFEKFMRFPDFYIVLTFYTNKLFNIFGAIPNIFKLELENYHSNLIMGLKEIKEIFNLNSRLIYTKLFNIFERFISYLNLYIPLDDNFNKKIDERIFEEKMTNIHLKCQYQLTELIKLFRDTGLSQYCSNDDWNYNSKVRIQPEWNLYLSLNDVRSKENQHENDSLDSILKESNTPITKKPEKIKIQVKNVKEILDINISDEMNFLKRKRNSELMIVQTKNVEIIPKKFTLKTDRLFSNNIKRLEFIPIKIKSSFI